MLCYVLNFCRLTDNRSITQGKIKRTKPFYVDQFAFTKTLVSPAVRYLLRMLIAAVS